ncbi:MAG: DUF4358 domain-containing protein [Ruminococcus sp.]|nr:DUF4358 domain-containing protein [Ruminococcus sp.]
MITHILKAICVICTAACAAGAFVSCGDASGSSVRDASSTPANVTSGDTSATDLTAAEFMEKALSQAPDSLLDTATAKGDTSDYGFDKFCKKLYGGTLPDDLEDGAISYASSGGNADEVSLLKAADPARQSELTDKLKERLDMRKRDFEGYKPEELPKIEKARIFEAGGFSILVIADNAEDIEKAFKNA